MKADDQYPSVVHKTPRQQQCRFQRDINNPFPVARSFVQIEFMI